MDIQLKLNTFLRQKGFEYVDFRLIKMRELFDYAYKNILSDRYEKELKDIELKKKMKEIESVTFCENRNCPYRQCKKHFINNNSENYVLTDFRYKIGLCKMKKTNNKKK